MKLEIGKKYTLERWKDTEVCLECLAIGNESWFWRDQDGVEMHSVIDDEWLLYEEEKKERWYEILVDQDPEGTIKQFTIWYCTAPTIGNEVLRQWDSKEEMIKDLKKV